MRAPPFMGVAERPVSPAVSHLSLPRFAARTGQQGLPTQVNPHFPSGPFAETILLPMSSRMRSFTSRRVESFKAILLIGGLLTIDHGSSSIVYPHSNWRERVGIEPTWDLIRAPHRV